MTVSTKKTYKSAERRYVKFCTDFNINPFPTNEAILCYYVACLGQEGLVHATIKTYLAGVRQLQLASGFPDPGLTGLPRLQQVLKGVRVEQGKRGGAPRPRLPITPNILRRMRALWLEGTPSADSLMLWSVASLAFFSFCRSGELTVPEGVTFDPASHLCYGDLSVNRKVDPSIVAIYLKHSKTDPYHRGVRITVGRTGTELCPVVALLAYLAQRESGAGPLFKWQSGTPLYRNQLVKEVRAVLTRAGLPAASFAGHSFRIGAATTAATVGVEDSLIQTLGRWKSSAYLLYIRLDPSKLAAVSRTLALGQV